MSKTRRKNIPGKDFFSRLPSTVSPHLGDLSPRPSLPQGEREERQEIRPHTETQRENQKQRQAGQPRGLPRHLQRRRSEVRDALAPGAAEGSYQPLAISQKTEVKINSDPSTPRRPLSPALSPAGREGGKTGFASRSLIDTLIYKEKPSVFCSPQQSSTIGISRVSYCRSDRCQSYRCFSFFLFPFSFFLAGRGVGPAPRGDSKCARHPVSARCRPERRRRCRTVFPRTPPPARRQRA